MNSVFTITNSTNNNGAYSFSIYGLDPQITFDQVGNHQYIFEI
jgi:hypothetical protein